MRLARTLELLTAVFDRLGIPYAIGGSVASSARGSYRATEDIDLVAILTPDHARQLPEALGKDWYADADQINSAILAGRAFNVIYMPFSQKVDIFPASDEFSRCEVGRATRLPLAAASGAEYPVASAEDIVLAKLAWYKAGGQTSQRQWTDIRNVIAANPEIDWAYLDQWAPRLGVKDLLARARDAER